LSILNTLKRGRSGLPLAGLSRLSFSSALTIAVVLLMAVPGGIGGFLFFQRSVQEAREAVVGELRLNAQGSFHQLRREVELLVTRARTLGFDSDLQMGTRSVLFFERIEQRLGSYASETQLSQGVWFYSQDNILVASSPARLEAMSPFPFDAAVKTWVASLQENESLRTRNRFLAFEASALLQRMHAANPGPALFLFTPVRDFLGASAGGVVTLIAPEAMRASLLTQLGDDADVQRNVSVARLSDHPSEITLSTRVVGETVESTLRFSGLEFTLHQRFTDRLAQVRKRNNLLIVFLCAGLFFLAASAFLLARVFVAPLEPLRGVVRAFGRGQYDVEKPQVAFLEFREFMDTLFALSGEIRERIKERELLARRDADIKREQTVAELGALRSQINPHFLFNALNGINSMLDIDTGQARAMLQDLSDLFREILECSRFTTIAVARETRIVERYLSLQKRRFGRRLEFSLELPAQNVAATLHVPALMVQTLVENAVKHGVESKREGGMVHVSFAPGEGETGGWVCTIHNTPKGESRSNVEGVGTGTGVSNTERRLRLLYGARGWFRLHVEATGEATASFWFSGDRVD